MKAFEHAFKLGKVVHEESTALKGPFRYSW